MHPPDPASVASGPLIRSGPSAAVTTRRVTRRKAASRSAVIVSGAVLEEMKTHAREAYPEECCGFLIGAGVSAEDDGPRAILALERARNESDGPRQRRFLIPAEELRQMERRVEPSGRTVVGFYHSHPDHPARPSQLDQDGAWPGYSYVVLSVNPADVPDVAAFQLDPDSLAFREVRLSILDTPALPPARTGGQARA